MAKEKTLIAGFDVGGAHLKAALAAGGTIVAAETIAMPLWQGIDRLHEAFAAIPFQRDAERIAITMTGELSDVFAARADGVKGLLDAVAVHSPVGATTVYAGPAGFLTPDQAAGQPAAVASANWHATAALSAQSLGGEALFVDMGSTTTDCVALAGGLVMNRGYSDAERLASGELVYTGFTRTFVFAVASEAPVRGALTPLMNEYFASMADVHRILGVLDESDDRHAAADGREKTVAGSLARLARMVGRDAAELDTSEWTAVAAWFSERQLRLVHDAAMRVSARLAPSAPVVAAGTGRWQIARLAARLGRPLVDVADFLPCSVALRGAVGSAAPACAVALLAAR